MQREENINITPEDLKPYEQLLCGLEKDDAKIIGVVKCQPSGLKFSTVGIVTLPTFTGNGQLYVFHGTADFNGFIQWKDFTSDSDILRIGSEAHFSVGIKSFCWYCFGRARNQNVQRTLLDRFNNKYYVRATLFFRRPTPSSNPCDSQILLESQEVHAERDVQSEATVLKKNGFKQGDVGNVCKVSVHKDLDIAFYANGKNEININHLAKPLKFCKVGDAKYLGEITTKYPGTFCVTIKQDGKEIWTLKYLEVSM